MTPNERWATAKQLRNTANIIYIINFAILISIFVTKCDTSKSTQQVSSSFNSNASVIAINGANVRQSPSITANVVDKVANNDRVLIIDSSGNQDIINGQEGNWFKVKTQDGNEGFIWSATVRQDK